MSASQVLNQTSSPFLYELYFLKAQEAFREESSRRMEWSAWMIVVEKLGLHEVVEVVGAGVVVVVVGSEMVVASAVVVFSVVGACVVVSVVTRRLFVASRRAAAAPRDNQFESDIKKIVISGLKIILKNIRNVLFTRFSCVELIFLSNAANLSSIF